MESASIARSSGRPAGRGFTITLWALQVLLALFFLMAGFNHGIRPIEEAAKTSPWITGIPAGLARFIGFAELAGAIGLILPSATRIKPWLTPLAAVGLAIIMALAVPFHIMRGESNVIGIHVIVTALSSFVAWGRFRKAPVAPRGA
jgi:putative oxidoreductase